MSIRHVHEARSVFDSTVKNPPTKYNLSRRSQFDNELLERAAGTLSGKSSRLKLPALEAIRGKATKNKLSTNMWTMRAFTTSCIILLVLVATYVPLTILFLIENSRGVYLFHGRGVFFSLPYLSSFLNPIIYIWRIPEVRRTMTQKCKIVRWLIDL